MRLKHIYMFLKKTSSIQNLRTYNLIYYVNKKGGIMLIKTQ